jgi:hypothetical protein
MADRKRHYWLREDFDELMGLLPGNDLADPGSADSSISLACPKSLKGAAAELKLRGLKCDEADLAFLADKGIAKPQRGQSLVSDDQGNVGTVPSAKVMFWSKQDIDAAAEWLYENEQWNQWTHFCWVSNLRFGQAVRAHRYMCARHNLGFTTSFDALGVVTVIEAPDDPDDYARVRFYPKGTKVEVRE